MSDTRTPHAKAGPSTPPGSNAVVAVLAFAGIVHTAHLLRPRRA